MSAQGIRAGAAFVEIFADDSKLMRSLAKSQVALKKWGKAASAAGTKLIAAGTAMLAPLLAATRAYASMGAEMARGAAKTGIAVESLSQLKYAAAQSGVGMEQLESGIARMNRAMLNAAEGSQQSVQAFAHLGLSVGQLSRMKPEEQFRAIAEALSKIKNPNLKSGLAQQIFGRSGAELLPLLSQGAAGIDKMMNRAKELGLVMSTDAATGALAFDQKLNDLWEVAKMGVFQIGGALAPVLTNVITAMSKGIAVVRDFVAAHQGLIVAVAGAAVGLITAGIALKVLGASLSLASTGVGILSSTLGIVGTVIGGLLSPIGIMTAGIVGGAAAFLYLTQAGAATRSYLSAVFNDLRDDTVTAFGGIKDAMASGDWGLAAKILWTYVKLEALKGKSLLQSTWISIKSEAIDAWSEIVEGIEKFWTYLKEYLTSWDGVKTGITKITNWISDTFQNTVNHVADLLQDLFMTTGSKQLKVALAEADQKESSGKWSHSMAEKARQTARDTFGGYDDKARRDRDAQRQADYNAKQKATDDAFGAKHPELVNEQETARKRIEDEQSARRKSNDSQADKARQAAIDQAAKELADLHSQLTNSANQAHAQAGKNRDFNAPTFDKQDAMDGLEGMMKSTVAGTFNAAGAFGLGSSNAAEQTAKNTEKTNSILGQMLLALHAQKHSGTASFA